MGYTLHLYFVVCTTQGINVQSYNPTLPLPSVRVVGGISDLFSIARIRPYSRACASVRSEWRPFLRVYRLPFPYEALVPVLPYVLLPFTSGLEVLLYNDSMLNGSQSN